MSEPDCIQWVERETLNVQKACRILNELEENGPMKPWTVLSSVVRENEDRDELRVDVLKPLTLKGYITPNADGDLYVDERMDFYNDYVVE
jgi:hypothetical protein